MGFLKKIQAEARRLLKENTVETLVAIGTLILSVGAGMIYKPAGYIIAGAIVLFIASVIYKNQ